MSLSLALAGSQIKRFRSALRSLAAIGSELLVEGIPERLVLRSINSARSAFLAVSFSANFFESYNVFGGSGLVQAGVLLKHILATFRTARVSSMSFDLSLQDAALRVTLKCDNGLVKRYGLDVTDAEILQANLDGQDLPVAVVAEAAELNKLLNTFQSRLDEITIIAQPEQQHHDSTAAAVAAAQKAVRIQSFYDPAKGLGGQSLHTSLQLDSHSNSVFKSYTHSGAHTSDVTVNLKDLKALVGLCVEMGVDVSLRFDAPGVPLLAVPHVRGGQEMDYTAELILATLQESQLEDAEDWPDGTTAAAAAAGNGHAAAATSDGFTTRDQRQTTGAVTPERADPIAPATTFAGAAAGAADAGETPQNRLNPAAAAAGLAGGVSGVGAARPPAAAAGSGAGGRSRSGAGSGLSRLQRLEAETEARAGRIPPYSRLPEGLAGVSGAAAGGFSGAGAGGSGDMRTPVTAAVGGHTRGANGLEGAWGQQQPAAHPSAGAPGFNTHQQQQQNLQQSEFASRSLGEFARQQQQQDPAAGIADMAVDDGTGDSQMDPETLPGRRGGVRSMFQQRMQAGLQQQHQQPQAFGSEQLLGDHQQQQQWQQQEDGVMEGEIGDSEEELPQTPDDEQQGDGAGFGFL